MSENANKFVIVVDAYSSGQFFPGLIAKRGLGCIHLRSDVEKRSQSFAAMVSHVKSSGRKKYELELAYDGSLETLLPELKGREVLAVLPGCESGVELADAVADALGLPGNGTALSSARRDKDEMQEAIRRAGIPAMRKLKSGNLSEIIDWAQQLKSWPIVIKPLRSAGTEGVFFCANEEEIKTAFSQLAGTKTFFGDTNNEILVEEFLSGTEHVVNTVSCRGRHFITDVWRYHKVRVQNASAVYDSTELLPYPDGELAPMAEYALKVLTALGIKNGPVHSEIMLTAKGPFLIECGARVMGGSFPPELLVECLGYTQAELTLDALLTPESFLRRMEKPYELKSNFLVKSMISSRELPLSEIPGISLISMLPTVRGGNFIGILEEAKVHRTVDLLTSPASVYLCDKDEKQLHEDYELLRSFELEAENELFEAAPPKKGADDKDWFKLIPDEFWLKPEDQAKADSEIIKKIVDIKPGIRILDCPCGDGRVSINLAGKGVLITGLDLNPRFIEAAQARFSGSGYTPKLIVSDMRDIDFKESFDLLLNWANSFGYFGIEEDVEVLRHFNKALVPGGQLIIEAPNQSGIMDNIRKKKYSGDKCETTWDPVTEKVELDVNVTINGVEKLIRSSIRMYSLAQYKLLFRCTGFRLLKVYDEAAREFSESSRRMVLLAKKERHIE